MSSHSFPPLPVESPLESQPVGFGIDGIISSGRPIRRRIPAPRRQKSRFNLRLALGVPARTARGAPVFMDQRGAAVRADADELHGEAGTGDRVGRWGAVALGERRGRGTVEAEPLLLAAGERVGE